MSTETEETTEETTDDLQGVRNRTPEPAEPEQEETTEEETEPETFPREYVEKLRKENADNRVKAKTADDLAARLHTALVTATGRLADPTDLPYDPGHLEDAETLTAAVDELLARKPHLANRKPRGDVGQGTSGSTSSVDLAGILRSRAN
ncbi:hypothetical protein [Arthrobacter sp. H14]|uniref:hypothetical protein n=1 Tax=Arthrobacter sp. H14 TaxID=1312959 RepID=UPI00047927C7|nr:hypothetical protein [Arthrobacter sp. H14]